MRKTVLAEIALRLVTVLFSFLTGWYLYDITFSVLGALKSAIIGVLFVVVIEILSIILLTYRRSKYSHKQIDTVMVKAALKAGLIVELPLSVDPATIQVVPIHSSRSFADYLEEVKLFKAKSADGCVYVRFGPDQQCTHYVYYQYNKPD